MARSANDPSTSMSFKGAPVPRTGVEDHRAPVTKARVGSGSGIPGSGWLGKGPRKTKKGSR